MSKGTALRRAAGWLLVALAAVGLVVAAGVAVLLATETGARFAVGMGLSRSPVPVAVESVEGKLTGPLTLTGIEVENRGIQIEVARVTLDWRPLALLGRRLVVDSLRVLGVAVTVPEDYEASPRPSETSTSVAEGPPALPELPVDIEIGDLRVEIERAVLEGIGELHSSALIGSGSPEAFDLALELNGSADPLESFEARSTLTGAPDDYRLDADLSFMSTDLPPVASTLSARGSLSGLQVDEARIRTANGEAASTATVSWYPELSWDVQATADGLEVAPFTPEPSEWPGAISFLASSTGRMGEGLEAFVRVEDVSGELRGERLSGGLDVTVEGVDVVLDTLGFTWGGIRADARGVLLDTLGLTIALEVPDLGLAVSDASGSVRLSGTVAGAREEPHVVASFEADDVTLDSLSVRGVVGDADLSLVPDVVSSLDVRVAQITSGTTVVDSVVVTADGTRGGHRMDADVWMENLMLETQAEGALVEGAETGARSWEGTLNAIDVGGGLLGDWGLEAPVPLFAAADSASIGDACLAGGSARVCLGGAWRNGGATAGELTIEALPLALLEARLPETLSLEGSVDGDARFAISADRTLSADGELTVEGTVDATVGTETVRFSLGGDGADFGVDEAGARADLDFALLPEVGEGSLEAVGHVELPGYSSVDTPLDQQPIEGTLEVSSADLSFVSAFVPDLANVGGRMRTEAEIVGTAAAPRVEGSILIEEGRGDIPVLGLQIRDLEVQASGDGEGGFDVMARLRSGEGELSIEGRAPLVPSVESPADLRIVGERFLAVGTPEIQVEIEPDLQILYDTELTRVQGSIAVPWARIELLEVPETAVSVSRDVVFVDEETVQPPPIDARVQVVVGDDVSFSGFGFTSMIEGDLDVRQEPGSNLPLTFGELRFIDGRFTAYGQNLDIDPGRIVFAGPPTNSSVDVTALRTAQDGTVAGLIVRGNIAQPEITLTSEPALPDPDVLSYILYGTRLSEGNASQQQNVSGAAATLGANVLTSQLASSVGLDEARIEGSSRDQAQLVTGKYLSPRVFVSYGVGLFKPSNTFRVKYLLNQNWAVQAESGDANGGDVLYQIERGR